MLDSTISTYEHIITSVSKNANVALWVLLLPEFLVPLSFLSSPHHLNLKFPTNLSFSTNNTTWSLPSQQIWFNGPYLSSYSIPLRLFPYQCAITSWRRRSLKIDPISHFTVKLDRQVWSQIQPKAHKNLYKGQLKLWNHSIPFPFFSGGFFLKVNLFILFQY